MTQPRHFLRLADLSPAELQSILNRGIELKRLRQAGKDHTPLANKVMTMIFEKSSTRTRVSFEAGMAQLGGHAIFLSSDSSQLGRGEPIADSARVLSSMTDILMIRTFEHKTAETLAKFSGVPVINGLTDDHHPCQLLADLMTYQERHGSISGKKVAWIGDGNNMVHSWIEAAKLLQFHLTIATPKGYEPKADMVAFGEDWITLSNDPQAAATGADIITTDVWASMGQEEEQKQRIKDFAAFQVTQDMMQMANPNGIFMHCLPAHRGEEVAADVIDGERSVVWQEAENRLHAQKALIEFLMQNR